MAIRVELCLVVLMLSGPKSVLAQEHAQISVWGGWTWADEVVGNTFVAPNGEIYEKVGAKNSGSWGIRGGVLVTRNAEVGFIFGQQRSTLQVSGLNTRDIGPMSIDTYHGYMGYKWGEFDQRVRLFAFIGLGSTHFGSVDFVTIAGQTQTIQSATKFSGTFGGGIEAFPVPRIGAQFTARWTPAFVKANSGSSWWCDPYWGCYLGSGQYLNQIELSGGVAFRF